MTGMQKPFHPTSDDLILFMDRELDGDFTRQIEVHLRVCAECCAQLKQLQDGVDAYGEYRRSVLQQSGEPVVLPEWKAIRNRAVSRGPRLWLWFAAAGMAAAAALVFFVSTTGQTDVKQTSDILARAENSPQQEPGALVFTRAGRKWRKTQEAPDVQHTRALFVQARYSWDRPLSAHSYAEWRNGLPEKQDQVSLIRDAQGAKSAYRLRTRTRAGLLRAASLTLRADTYHPTDASFEFQGEDPIEVSEDLNVYREETRHPAPVLSRPAPAPGETVVGPEEELRVLAALSAIGADAEEPVAVQLDAARHHVLVTALGLPLRRQKEISRAVADLPDAVVRFSAVQPRKTAAAGTDTYSADGDSVFRRKLEAQTGGAARWQEIADRALDLSSGLFARTHSLLLLAQDFGPKVEATLSPASRETLRGLQQRQVGAIQYATRQLQQTLTPVMESDTPSTGNGIETGRRPWQNGAVHLYEQAKILDGLLERFLAGNYDEETGTKFQKDLPQRLSQIERLLREQTSSRSQ